MCDYESVREQLMAQVECQMSNLACVDAHELGEVIDMIKDLEEAKYYCSITEEIEKASEEETIRINKGAERINAMLSFTF